jgi:hypothetical protein
VGNASTHGTNSPTAYLLEVGLDNKTLRSTQFVDGIAGAVASYEISTTNEQSIVAARKDATGRLQEAITINRFTAEAQFHWFVYGGIETECGTMN